MNLNCNKNYSFDFEFINCIVIMKTLNFMLLKFYNKKHYHALYTQASLLYNNNIYHLIITSINVFQASFIYQAL